MIEIFLKKYTDGTCLITKILLDGKIISQFDKETSKTSFKPLYDIKDKYNESILITEIDETNNTFKETIMFDVVKTHDGYVLHFIAKNTDNKSNEHIS